MRNEVTLLDLNYEKKKKKKKKKWMLIQCCKEACVLHSLVEVNAAQNSSSTRVFLYLLCHSLRKMSYSRGIELPWFLSTAVSSLFVRGSSRAVWSQGEEFFEVSYWSMRCLLTTLKCLLKWFILSHSFSLNDFLPASHHHLKPRVNFPIAKSRSSFHSSLYSNSTSIRPLTWLCTT